MLRIYRWHVKAARQRVLGHVLSARKISFLYFCLLSTIPFYLGTGLGRSHYQDLGAVVRGLLASVFVRAPLVRRVLYFIFYFLISCIGGEDPCMEWKVG